MTISGLIMTIYTHKDILYYLLPVCTVIDNNLETKLEWLKYITANESFVQQRHYKHCQLLIADGLQILARNSC